MPPSPLFSLLNITRLLSNSIAFSKNQPLAFWFCFLTCSFYLLPLLTLFGFVLLFFSKFLNWMSSKLTYSLFPPIQRFRTTHFLPSINFVTHTFWQYFHYNLAIRIFKFPLWFLILCISSLISVLQTPAVLFIVLSLHLALELHFLSSYTDTSVNFSSYFYYKPLRLFSPL